MSTKSFFDTNILLYAYDLDAGKKRETAQHLIEQALLHPTHTVISVQVLQEFFVNFTRRGQSDKVAARLIDDFSYWQIVPNTHELLLSGLEIKARWQLSLWDAMIIAAATEARCPILYTEDLNHDQNYGSVRALNPFLTAP